MRLAAAAAGMGKVDEALRIERKVASGDGEPGPRDPRRWARLHSAVRLARMILEARAGGEKDKLKALERNLKRTQVLGTPSTMVLLVWEDLEAGLELKAERGDEDFPVAERVLSRHTGLMMVDIGQSPPDDLELSVKLHGQLLRRAVPFALVTIAWDGKSFSISEQQGEVAPRKDGWEIASADETTAAAPG